MTMMYVAPFWIVLSTLESTNVHFIIGLHHGHDASES